MHRAPTNAQARKDYLRGWNYSSRSADLEYADDKGWTNSHDWQDGYDDVAIGREKFTSLNTPELQPDTNTQKDTSTMNTPTTPTTPTTISSNHYSVDEQSKDAMGWLSNNQPEAYAAVIEQMPEYLHRVMSGAWFDTEKMSVDAEWGSWLVDAIEATGFVIWEDGEPWTVGEEEEGKEGEERDAK